MIPKVLDEIWTEHNKARAKYPVEHDDQFGWEHLAMESDSRIQSARDGESDSRKALVQSVGLLISAIEWIDRHSITPGPDGQEKLL